ncbi:hypothetical protein [Chryseobacterium indoltheticum]|uniref:WYL domain-containing protein n=1 Tax=Chryseobacterium indoltheticum TaxID=254 RepID=A0A381FD10_9FLAO|nr:hypothetical protein [Chryseobacterium indoltheticum]AZA73774.1 hypothetical protein EG358_08415 [Chryseobacterium indoltheticum]SIQ94733.1 hypothetical protein SAMN05421682_110118 [Chryseobacterium indoltheticum]SUX43972.1 Uncharacterised protein [Chryseobacterium indoltheticum]
MITFSIGDFVCLQNHPYFNKNQNIKIAANAEMTPPIMIVGEILNKDEYNPLNGRQSEIQLRCYYYSTKDGKYIDKWIKAEQIKKLESDYTYLDIEKLINIENFDLEFLKESLLNKLVCIKSVDFELNKKKIFIDSSDGIRTNKENNHLEFLPPVMTVIDIVKNKEEKKYSSTKESFVEKDLSKYMFKCKWYNPKTSSYSEELIPSVILGIVKNQTSDLEIISSGINENGYIIIDLKNDVELEDSSRLVGNTIIKPTELIFNHYYYKLSAFDYMKQRTASYPLGDIRKNVSLDDFTQKAIIFGQIYPRYKTIFRPITANIFTENEYYLIKYRDKSNKITTRIIKLIYKEPYTDQESNSDQIFLVSNCLLRKGHIRHFTVSQILESTEILNGIEIFENATS